MLSSSFSSSYAWFYWLGFIYVLQRCFLISNAPTFQTPNDRSDLPDRLRTALFYVPFVTGSAVVAPMVFKLFISVMIWKGLSEYFDILHYFNQASEIIKADPPEKNEKNHKKFERFKFTSLERVIQVLSLVQYWSANHSFMLLSFVYNNAFLIFAAHYLVYLSIWKRKERIGASHLVTFCTYWFGYCWISWSLSLTPIMLNEFVFPEDNLNHGGGYVSLVLLISWFGDAAGYFIGKKVGKHQAVPNISPSKTVEGMYATVISSVFISLAFKSVQIQNGMEWTDLPPLSWPHYFIFGLATGILGVLGDLCESFIKRLGSVKDSGIFFPGHGGILDRFDTFFFCSIFTFYYYRYCISLHLF